MSGCDCRTGWTPGSTARLFNNALARGVLYVPGGFCFPPAGVPAESHTIRLSFGVQSAENLRRGVAALAESIRELGAAGKPRQPTTSGARSRT